jgi:hypothetical protein
MKVKMDEADRFGLILEAACAKGNLIKKKLNPKETFLCRKSTL